MTSKKNVIVEDYILLNYITYVVQFLNKCLCCKKCKSLRLNQKEYEERYKEGEAKFKWELDCVSILNSLRQLDTLKRLLLNENQLSIMKFSK